MTSTMNSSPIKLIARSFDIALMLRALDRHPEVWDTRTARTGNELSPHYGLSDIWARFAPMGSGALMEHKSVWYEDVSSVLPIEEMAQRVIDMTGATELGGVLITRIPPGAICKPHIDTGWHAESYEKIAVQLAANDKQAFCFENTKLVTEPGDVFWFNNQHLHWVTNDSNEDRMTAIFCVRPFSTKE